MTATPKPHPSQPPASQPLSRRLWRVVRRFWSVSAGLLLAPTAQPHAHRADTFPSGADKRRHPRIPLKNTTVHVTDGCLFATARIGNISPAGLCLCDLPEQLYHSANRLTVYSSDNPGLPVLQIRPCWQHTGWGGKTIGAIILNATDAWRLFFVHAAGQVEA